MVLVEVVKAGLDWLCCYVGLGRMELVQDHLLRKSFPLITTRALFSLQPSQSGEGKTSQPDDIINEPWIKWVSIVSPRAWQQQQCFTSSPPVPSSDDPQIIEFSQQFRSSGLSTPGSWHWDYRRLAGLGVKHGKCLAKMMNQSGSPVEFSEHQTKTVK